MATIAYGRPARSSALRGIVDRLWYVADPGQCGDELKLPTTTAQIVINLDGARLSTRSALASGEAVTCGSVGLSTIARTAVVLDRREQRRAAGIVIRPEAVGAVAGCGTEDLGALVGLDFLWSSAVAQIVEVAAAGSSGPEVLDLVECAFARLLGSAEVDTSCRAAIGLLREGRQVAEVAEVVGLSHSTLTRRFRGATGMTAKNYQRLLRLERMLGLVGAESSPDWAAIAIHSGCYDQAHLSHEFTELTGLTPARWRRSVAGNPFHVPIETISSKTPRRSGEQTGSHE